MPIISGRSDKYGQVYVEKVGHTGFDDAEEPVALFRAQDKYALWIMKEYLRALEADSHVSAEQLDSVRRQIKAFETWSDANPEKLRTPGFVGLGRNFTGI